jgi:hypothetical protein
MITVPDRSESLSNMSDLQTHHTLTPTAKWRKTEAITCQGAVALFTHTCNLSSAFITVVLWWKMNGFRTLPFDLRALIHGRNTAIMSTGDLSAPHPLITPALLYEPPVWSLRRREGQWRYRHYTGARHILLTIQHPFPFAGHRFVRAPTQPQLYFVEYLSATGCNDTSSRSAVISHLTLPFILLGDFNAKHILGGGGVHPSPTTGEHRFMIYLRISIKLSWA